MTEILRIAKTALNGSGGIIYLLASNRQYLQLEAVEGINDPIAAEIKLFRPSDLSNEWALMEELNAFVSEDFHILHLACHAKPYPRNPRRSKLIICDNNDFLLRYFTQPKVKAQITAPLVFLNACESGVRNASQTYHFVKELQLRGAQNVVAIEAAIKSKVAENLAIIFYNYLLQHESLGNALYLAKKDLIDSGTNVEDVYNIFYSLYGDEGFAINL